jgi:hypothetical protein
MRGQAGAIVGGYAGIVAGWAAWATVTYGLIHRYGLPDEETGPSMTLSVLAGWSAGWAPLCATAVVGGAVGAGIGVHLARALYARATAFFALALVPLAVLLTYALTQIYPTVADDTRVIVRGIDPSVVWLLLLPFFIAVAFFLAHGLAVWLGGRRLPAT